MMIGADDIDFSDCDYNNHDDFMLVIGSPFCHASRFCSTLIQKIKEMFTEIDTGMISTRLTILSFNYFAL